MVDFRKFLTLEVFGTFINYEVEASAHRGRGKQTGYMDHVREELAPLFREFLQEAASEGLIQPITRYPNSQISAIEGWNDIISGGGLDRPWSASNLLTSMAFNIIWTPTYMCVKNASGEAPTADVIQAAYDEMVEGVNAGNLTDEHRGVECYDSKSGKRLSFTVTGWNPVFTYFDMETRDFIEHEDADPPQNFEVEIEVTSGKMLAFDWLRIQEFTDASETRHPMPEINADDGKVEYTKMFAEKSNMVHVSAGNSYPGILVRDNHVIACHMYDSETESDDDLIKKLTWANPGRVCCDLWWVTIADREAILDVLKDNLSADEAEKVLDDYIAEHGCDVQFKLRPGKYKLSFGSSQAFFNEHFDKEAHELPASFEPILLMEPVK